MKTTLKTPLGTVYIEGDENGISKISVIEAALENAKPTTELAEAVQQLTEYFEGKRRTFDFKINPQGTGFQKSVWKELLKIPFGKTISYLDLARALGDEKKIRAAASANGKNPLWIVVPCHRVIGSDGSLVGYAGGLWRKKWLLEHEQDHKQISLF